MTFKLDIRSTLNQSNHLPIFQNPILKTSSYITTKYRYSLFKINTLRRSTWPKRNGPLVGKNQSWLNVHQISSTILIQNSKFEMLYRSSRSSHSNFRWFRLFSQFLVPRSADRQNWQIFLKRIEGSINDSIEIWLPAKQ